MNKIVNPKILVPKLLDYLDKSKGLKPRAIASHTGLKYSPIRSIKNRGSGGTMEMVATLIEHYPELIKEFDLESPPDTTPNEEIPEMQERLKRIEMDNQIMKEMLVRLLRERAQGDDEDVADQIEQLLYRKDK